MTKFLTVLTATLYLLTIDCKYFYGGEDGNRTHHSLLAGQSRLRLSPTLEHASPI